jgi:transcriptional regulator with XRE-family HTH domain
MNRQIIPPIGAEPWLVALIELKNKSDLSVAQIANKENLAEKSVINVFTGKSKSPGVDLIRRIIHALGGSWAEIFAESGAVIGGQDLVSLSEEVDVTSAERDLVAAENAILKDKVTALQAELDLVKMQLKHKEELLALHNYYNKIIPQTD